MISVWSNYNIIESCRELKRILNLSNTIERRVQLALLGKLKPINNEFGALDQFAQVITQNHPQDLADLVYLCSLKSAEIFEQTINERHSDEVYEEFELFCKNNNASWPISSVQLKNLFKTFENNENREIREGGAISKGIKLNTIHAAKGLEYDAVFITGLSKGNYPNTSKIDQEYQRRIKELNGLRNSNDEFIKLKQETSTTLFQLILSECTNRNFTADKRQALYSLKEELLENKVDILNFTADGINLFLDSFRYYVSPLISRYQTDLNREYQSLILLDNKLQYLSEEIDLISQTAENIQDKKSEQQQIMAARENIIKTGKDIKKKQSIFKKSIGTILNHHVRCLKAKGYLEDIKKLREIGKIKKILTQNKEKQENEEKRTFYVALTRARDLLYLCHEKGSPPSPFISIISQNLRINYTMLTKHEDNEFNRLKSELRQELYKIDVDDEIVMQKTDRIINYRRDLKERVRKRIEEFVSEHKIFINLTPYEKTYLDRAVGLLNISEVIGHEFNMEIIHNLQRLSEERLITSAGKGALVFRTKELSIIENIVEKVRNILSKGETPPPSREYIREIFFEKDTKQLFLTNIPNLKKIGIIHFVTRTKNIMIPKSVRNSWNIGNIKNENEENFLLATKELSNIRNKLIHENTSEWPENPLPKVFRYIEIIFNNC